MTYKATLTNETMKFDPYKTKERYLRWKEEVKEEGITDITPFNSQIILQYLHDMEKGINISMDSAKGSRSYMRLTSLRERLTFFCKKFSGLYHVDKITEISEERLIEFFADMKNGTITRKDGKNYKSVETTAKIFKAFWHWWMKVNKKKGVDLKDITLDLDTKQEKPDWVYMTEEDVRLLVEKAKHDYKALIWFLFDTGIRAPTEMMNIKVSDFYNEFKEVNIREEVSKTFGRKIKLMICSQIIKDYISHNKLEPNDFLFTKNHYVINKYLKKLAKNVLGEGITLAGGKYSDLTMYDFRHISCCYWMPRYKSESALKYRFGWKKSDKIHYYSELLGMRDTISEEDMLVDLTRTEIEQRLLRAEKDKEIMNEKMNAMDLELIELKKNITKLLLVSPLNN